MIIGWVKSSRSGPDKVVNEIHLRLLKKKKMTTGGIASTRVYGVRFNEYLCILHIYNRLPKPQALSIYIFISSQTAPWDPKKVSTNT